VSVDTYGSTYKIADNGGWAPAQTARIFVQITVLRRSAVAKKDFAYLDHALFEKFPRKEDAHDANTPVALSK
jgi:hypothetical protein